VLIPFNRQLILFISAYGKNNGHLSSFGNILLQIADEALLFLDRICTFSTTRIVLLGIYLMGIEIFLDFLL